MRLVMILTAFFICISGYNTHDPNPIKVEAPKGYSEKIKGKKVIVLARGDNKIFIEEKEVTLANLDSLLGIEINKKRGHGNDSITVVINADTATSYGLVFQIVRSAKKLQAKVMTQVNN